jgi:hypothetical protein
MPVIQSQKQQEADAVTQGLMNILSYDGTPQKEVKT